MYSGLTPLGAPYPEHLDTTFSLFHTPFLERKDLHATPCTKLFSQVSLRQAGAPCVRLRGT